MNDTKALNLIRQNTSFSFLYQEDYIMKKRTYQQQYANIYFLRLLCIRPTIIREAQQKWENKYIEERKIKHANRLLDIHRGEICWVIGTIYMDAPFKPNILNDVKKDYWMVSPTSEKYINHEKNDIILEDEFGRVRLVGSKISQEFLVTGCVIGVLGFEIQDGNFQVIDICLPGMPCQNLISHPTDVKIHKYVALVSGLNITGNACDSLTLFLLAEYLNGEMGCRKDQMISSQIVQLIIAGNSVVSLKDKEDTSIDKKKTYNTFTYNAKPMNMLDTFLSDICVTTSVVLMPGESDPSNVLLPQQPIHFSMLPNAKHYSGSTLTLCTNPAWLEIDGIKFLGSSGQTINDIYKYTNEVDKLKIMEHTLRWQHCAPTAPDTLWCYPFSEKDPFLISEAPHVYFLGNQEKFDTKFIEGENEQKIRLIMLPVFSETGMIVLVNLSTLECEQVKFNIDHIMSKME